ncbi:MAG: FG-GAP repeat domain-containing protein [Candidatus Woesearchaeota archaeon]
MKRGFGVCILIVSILCVGVFASLGVNDIDNKARIADFNNDGRLDILAFSDRIDSRLAYINLYTQTSTNTFSPAIRLVDEQLKRCALSYGDYNNNSYLDIVYACFNQSDHMVSGLLTNSGGTFIQEDFFTSELYTGPFQTTNSQILTYGDILVLDFTNNGHPDILSCFHGEENLSLFLSDGESFTQIDSGIPRNIFKKNGEMTNCFLTPLDVNANGVTDIIAYQYDANNFSLFTNQFCNATTCQEPQNAFAAVTDDNAFNQTYFANKKIKHLRAFDVNQNGFSDLFYIADVSDSSASPRNITYGHFLNNAFDIAYEPALTPPVIEQFTYQHVSPQHFRLSWKNYTENQDFYQIRITPSTFSLIPNGRTDQFAATYNLLLTNNVTRFGEPFVSSYDHHAGFGNLLTRTDINLSIQPQCFNVSAQAISRSGMMVNSSLQEFPVMITVEDNTFPIELCDGLDNTCTGVADDSFTFFWPDGNNSTITFERRGERNLMVGPTQTFTNPNNLSQNITFDCTSWLFNTNNQNFWEPSSSSTNTISPGSGGATTAATQVEQESGSSPFENQEPEPEPEPQDPQPQEPQSQSQSFATKPFEQFFEIEYRNERTYVIETIQNIERTKKTDIIIRKEFPTTTLQSASLLQSRTPIIIQRENPIIDFFIGDLDYLEQYRMQYSLPGTIEEHQIRAVQTVMLADQQYTQEQIELLEQEQEEIANRAVNTSITETQVGDNTVFTIRVDLQDDVDTVRNVEIEQYIPKCLIEEVNELILRTGIDENYINNVQIKEADPIIVWTFEELRAGEESQLFENHL